MKICSIAGCETPVGPSGARGMCPKHYSRFMRTGRPEFNLRAPVRERFLRYENRGDPDACWEWLGNHDQDGYGNLWVNGTQKRASRLAVEFATGIPVPTGVLVCHRCDNPPCVNPRHLFLGSVRDNSQDASRKGRIPGCRYGVRTQYKLTNEQIAEIIEAGNPWPGSRRLLAQQYGVSYQHIRAIQVGQRRINDAPPDYGVGVCG